MASKSQIEMGGGSVTLGVNDGPLVKGLEAASKKFQAWGKGIAAAGVGMAAMGAAVTAPFLAGLSVFQNWGAEMRSGMRQTGIGFEQLTYLTQGLGASVDEIAPAVARMSAFLHHAASGSGEANAALTTLGLTLEELSSMSQGDRLQRFAEALGSVADQGERIRLQGQILGRRSLEAINTQGGAEGMAARAAHRQHIEGKPSKDDMVLAATTAKAFKEMGLAIKAVWREIGAAAAPVMLDFYRLVTGVVVGIRQFVTANRETLTIVFRVFDALVLVGGIIGTLGGVVYGSAFAFNFLAGAVGIVGAALGSLWGFAVFASSGFGILSASVFSWSTITAGASAASTVAVWAWGFAVAGVSALVSGAYAAWGFATAIVTGAQAALNVVLGLFGFASATASAATAISTGAMTAMGVGALGASTAVAGATAATGAWAVVVAAWGFTTTAVTAMVTGAFAAWAALVWLVTTAHTIGAFALGGFGIATAAVTALTWLDNAALAVWNAGVWLINAAHVAAVAALGLFTGATTAGTAATGVFSGALIFAWIWENICTAGIYLIVTAIGLLIAAVVLVPLAWLSWLLILGIIAGVTVAIGSVGVALVALAAGVASMALAVVAIAASAAAQLSDRFGHAFDSLMPAASAAFDGVLGTVRTAVAAIGDAMTAGDFALVWEVVKTAAEVAWLEITDFVTAQFPAWKAEALGIWTIIADALEDALTAVFIKLKTMWQELIGQIIAGAYRAWAAVQREMGLDTRAAANEERATQAERNAQQDAETTRQNANRDRIDRENARRRRREAAIEAELERESMVSDDEGGPNAERIAELRERLEGLRDTAREEAALREWMSQTGEAEPHGGDQGLVGAADKNKAVGSFFADALAGMFGAGGDTPADRQLRAQNRTNQLLEDIARRLNGMDGGAFA